MDLEELDLLLNVSIVQALSTNGSWSFTRVIQLVCEHVPPCSTRHLPCLLSINLLETVLHGLVEVVLAFLLLERLVPIDLLGDTPIILNAFTSKLTVVLGRDQERETVKSWSLDRS